MSFYTTGDIEKKLHIKRNRLKEWIARGYIIPTRQEKTGTGMMSLFDKWGVYCIKAFDQMLSEGFSRDVAAGWIEYVETFLHKVNTFNETDVYDENNNLMPKIQDLPSLLKLKKKSRTKEGEVYDFDMIWGNNLGVFDKDDISNYILNFEFLRKEVDFMLKD